MNTFFFGYLPYKTRRVVRTILFIIGFVIGFWAFDWYSRGTGFGFSYFTVYITLIGIVSYVLEPFIKFKK